MRAWRGSFPTEASWRGLGASWGALGASCRRSWRVCCYNAISEKIGIDLQPILKRKSVPKGEQNGAQNGPKSSAKFNMKQEGFEDPLGSVLGLSWVVLGSILGSKIIKFHLFLRCFVKIHIFDTDKV